MSSIHERQAAAVSVPQVAESAGAPVSVLRANVTSAEVWVIPEYWKGKYVCFRQIGGQRAAIRFGTAVGVSVSLTATATLSTNTLTAAAATPHIVVEAGNAEHELIDPSWTHLAHISPDTAGYLLATVRTAD